MSQWRVPAILSAAPVIYFCLRSMLGARRLHESPVSRSRQFKKKKHYSRRACRRLNTHASRRRHIDKFGDDASRYHDLLISLLYVAAPGSGFGLAAHDEGVAMPMMAK